MKSMRFCQTYRSQWCFTVGYVVEQREGRQGGEWPSMSICTHHSLKQVLLSVCSMYHCVLLDNGFSVQCMYEWALHNTTDSLCLVVICWVMYSIGLRHVTVVQLDLARLLFWPLTSWDYKKHLFPFFHWALIDCYHFSRLIRDCYIPCVEDQNGVPTYSTWHCEA